MKRSRGGSRFGRSGGWWTLGEYEGECSERTTGGARWRVSADLSAHTAGTDYDLNSGRGALSLIRECLPQPESYERACRAALPARP
jgi:hypothetical protein